MALVFFKKIFSTLISINIFKITKNLNQYLFVIDELLAEKEKYKNISEELDQTLNELQGY